MHGSQSHDWTDDEVGRDISCPSAFEGRQRGHGVFSIESWVLCDFPRRLMKMTSSG